ncbi:SRPBCC domain-containing protein [Aquihabitans daechungensis]|uniref:SRPBCC domain-containing protein n=1 Tax=Aquihabitans daechungensis TaxID=1052257 RepID=UPI003BA26EB3
MNDSTDLAYDGIVERTSDGGVIRFERRLPYPVRDVWSAITDPDRLGDWWLPFDADISVDLREGGEMRFVGRDDEPFEMRFTILRVEAPMLLEHTHADPGSRMRWEARPPTRAAPSASATS